MDNPGEILRLCRLCLVKDQVNIPIFEEQGDIRQIFLKISSCLPVKVSLEDKLPKRICDGCSNKLDLLYEFWNTSANAEKTLLSWLGQAGVKDADETISAVAQQIAKPAETHVKQEALDEGHASNQVHDSFGVQSFDEEAKDESEAPPPKRARRTAAVKAQINLTPESDEDDDMDSAEAMTKVEDESDESDGEDKDPSYGEIPGTSADDQAGPSGVGKDGVEAPKIVCIKVKPKAVLRTIKCVPQKRKSCDTRKKQTQCDECGEFVDNIYKHRRKHVTFSCNQCPCEFKTIRQLRTHQEVHQSDIKYDCDFCALSFVAPFKLAYHRYVHTSEYQCPICELKAPLNTMRAHIARHEDNFKFRCSYCDKGFNDKTFLKNHEDMHEGVRKYECHLCPKKFAVQDYLKAHIRTMHKKEVFGVEETYQCEICGNVFTLKKSLQNHLSVIHNIGRNRRKECPICHKTLKHNAQLQKHIKLHTGEKDIECGDCGRMFSNGEYLKRHQLKVHIRKSRSTKNVSQKQSEESDLDEEKNVLQKLLEESDLDEEVLE